MNEFPFLKIIGVVGAVFAVACWILFVQFMLSWISGWRRLAATYGIGASELPPNLSFQAASGQVGFINYNGTLKLATDAMNLYLSPIFLFALTHKKLRVPLPNVHNASEEKLLFVFKRTRFEIDGVKFSIHGKAGTAITEALQHQSQTPQAYNPLFVR